jgi:predicted nucleic acid-binding protein
MTLLVDTSVWSLALRRDSTAKIPEVLALEQALVESEEIVTTGLVLQELLQGFIGPRDHKKIMEHFVSLPFLVPGRTEYVAAAQLRNQCRRAGLQIGTIDALLAQLCIRHNLTLLTTDNDFSQAAKHVPLRVWRHM